MQKPSTIILIDDNSTTNFLNSKIIEKWSSQISTLVYEDPKKALEELQGNYSDCLVFVDLNMPIMDGWELIENFGKTDFCSKNTIIVLTSSVDARDSQRAEENENISGFASKPLTLEILNELTQRFFK